MVIYVTKVIKIGNSMGIIFPKYVLNIMGWKLGDIIDMEVKNKKLIMKKIEKDKNK